MSLARFALDIVFCADVDLSVADLQPKTTSAGKRVRLWDLIEPE